MMIVSRISTEQSYQIGDVISYTQRHCAMERDCMYRGHSFEVVCTLTVDLTCAAFMYPTTRPNREPIHGTGGMDERGEWTHSMPLVVSHL